MGKKSSFIRSLFQRKPKDTRTNDALQRCETAAEKPDKSAVKHTDGGQSSKGRENEKHKKKARSTQSKELVSTQNTRFRLSDTPPNLRASVTVHERGKSSDVLEGTLGVVRATRSAENIHKSCYYEGLLSHGRPHAAQTLGSDDFVDRLKNLGRGTRRRSYGSIPTVVTPERPQPVLAPFPRLVLEGRMNHDRDDPEKLGREQQVSPNRNDARNVDQLCVDNPDKVRLRERRQQRQKYHAERTMSQEPPVYRAAPLVRTEQRPHIQPATPQNPANSRNPFTSDAFSESRLPNPLPHLSGPGESRSQGNLYRIDHVDSVGVDGLSRVSTLERHHKQTFNISDTGTLEPDESALTNGANPVVHYHVTIQNCDGINVILNNPEGSTVHPQALVSDKSGELNLLSWVQCCDSRYSPRATMKTQDARDTRENAAPIGNHIFQLESTEWEPSSRNGQAVCSPNVPSGWQCQAEVPKCLNKERITHRDNGGRLHLERTSVHTRKQNEPLNRSSIRSEIEHATDKHRRTKITCQPSDAKKEQEYENRTPIGDISKVDAENQCNISANEVRQTAPKLSEGKVRPIAQVSPFRVQCPPRQGVANTRGLQPVSANTREGRNSHAYHQFDSNQRFGFIPTSGIIGRFPGSDVISSATSMSSLTTEALLEADAHGDVPQEDMNSTLDGESSGWDTNSVIEVSMPSRSRSPSRNHRQGQTLRTEQTDQTTHHRSLSADRNRMRDIERTREVEEMPFRRHQSVRERRRVQENDLPNRVSSIKRELARVPGVLIVSVVDGRLLVYLSRDRPNVEGVVRFMRTHGVRQGDYDCQVVPWSHST